MNRHRVLRVGLWLLAFSLFGLQSAIRQDTGATPEMQPAGPECPVLAGSELTADFDGDHIPDLAIGSTNGLEYTVRVQFTTKLPSASLTLFEGGPGIRIFSRDVDSDNRPDIVVTGAASRFPIAIWISDRNGGFHAANPWSYFPSQMGIPCSLEPLQSGDSFAGISEDDRAGGIQPNTSPAFADLQARDRIVTRPAQAPPQIILSEFPVRGPPSDC